MITAARASSSIPIADPMPGTEIHAKSGAMPAVSNVESSAASPHLRDAARAAMAGDGSSEESGAITGVSACPCRRSGPRRRPTWAPTWTPTKRSEPCEYMTVRTVPSGTDGGLHGGRDRDDDPGDHAPDFIRASPKLTAYEISALDAWQNARRTLGEKVVKNVEVQT